MSSSMLSTREYLFVIRETGGLRLSGGLDKPLYIPGIHMHGRASLS
jgi:hypothetical protein